MMMLVVTRYAWHFAALSGWDSRGLLMAVLITMWGVRLTFNFWRKGGYNGEEDYRWAVLRTKINNKFLFTIFNLTFISMCGALMQTSKEKKKKKKKKKRKRKKKWSRKGRERKYVKIQFMLDPCPLCLFSSSFSPFQLPALPAADDHAVGVRGVAVRHAAWPH